MSFLLLLFVTSFGNCICAQGISGVRSFEDTSVRWPGKIVQYRFGTDYKNTSDHNMIRAANGSYCYPSTCIKFQFGVIVHELMHVLGFLHEQSRPDRNNFIQVEWKNIHNWGRDQFYKYGKQGETCSACPKTTKQNLTTKEIKELNSCCDKNKVVNVFGGYDYGSIMHYEIKNGFGLKMDIDTMKSLKNVLPEVEIGQRTAMSPLDVEKVNEMYQCPSKEEKCITKSVSLREAKATGHSFALSAWDNTALLPDGEASVEKIRGIEES
ncbi:tok [Lepeophtheirus salmonis]|uniref:Metalloendopeptidase n=1 Tax=Lepeophtheirus salmonis TaxID=72036 RepID=A0A817FAH1_LEPSM|nr:tok [Lepeophtheirus salmonis]CAG9476371.1 tok [Lepeophtheirus salmonis]